jgi:photosystem II stability/assembly factor-like uncharacterized protein
MRIAILLLISLIVVPISYGQWAIQDSKSTADLRGVDSVGNGVAWASGSGGTVLRTTDAGKTWTRCTTPPDAAKLDFRGVQAFDEKTAIVMSSGKGDASRLYKTIDGCATWKKVFDDPDETGFFDSLRRVTGHQLYLLGDPVGGKFSMFSSRDMGDTWFIADDPGLEAVKDAGAFAASNTALMNIGPFLIFGTGGPKAVVYASRSKCDPATPTVCSMIWEPTETPLAHGVPAAGVFSLGGRFSANAAGKTLTLEVAVGGTYNKPDDASAAGVTSRDGGLTWTLAVTQPHGYRSALAYDRTSLAWIAVGPNGTDVSTDDGQNWQAVKPTGGDTADADQKWNALSLPFAVGPKGRIGLLETGVLKAR